MLNFKSVGLVGACLLSYAVASDSEYELESVDHRSKRRYEESSDDEPRKKRVAKKQEVASDSEFDLEGEHPGVQRQYEESSDKKGRKKRGAKKQQLEMERKKRIDEGHCLLDVDVYKERMRGDELFRKQELDLYKFPYPRKFRNAVKNQGVLLALPRDVWGEVFAWLNHLPAMLRFARVSTHTYDLVGRLLPRVFPKEQLLVDCQEAILSLEKALHFKFWLGPVQGLRHLLLTAGNFKALKRIGETIDSDDLKKLSSSLRHFHADKVSETRRNSFVSYEIKVTEWQLAPSRQIDVIRIGLVPPLMRTLSKLSLLKFSKVGLYLLPTFLQKLHHLTQLDLSENQLSGAVDLTGCAQLQTLDLSNNQLKQVTLPPSVTSANMGINWLIGIECSAGSDFPNLKALSLRSNYICELNLDRFPRLENLNLSLSPVQRLMGKGPGTLQALNLVDTPLMWMPEVVVSEGSPLKYLNIGVSRLYGGLTLPIDQPTVVPLPSLIPIDRLTFATNPASSQLECISLPLFYLADASVIQKLVALPKLKGLDFVGPHPADYLQYMKSLAERNVAFGMPAVLNSWPGHPIGNLPQYGTVEGWDSVDLSGENTERPTFQFEFPRKLRKNVNRLLKGVQSKGRTLSLAPAHPSKDLLSPPFNGEIETDLSDSEDEL